MSSEALSEKLRRLPSPWIHELSCLPPLLWIQGRSWHPSLDLASKKPFLVTLASSDRLDVDPSIETSTLLPLNVLKD